MRPDSPPHVSSCRSPKARCSRRARRHTGKRSSPRLVGGRAVDGRQRHIVQAEIDTELAPIMNEVVQVQPHHRPSWSGEEHLVTLFEGPWSCPCRVRVNPQGPSGNLQSSQMA